MSVPFLNRVNDMECLFLFEPREEYRVTVPLPEPVHMDDPFPLRSM